MRPSQFRLVAAVAAFAALISLSPPAGGRPPAETRREAERLHRDGNWRDAFELWRDLALDPADESAQPGQDLARAADCLANLNRRDEADDLRERFVAAHAGHWRSLAAAGQSYADADHHGTIVAGEFKRGPQRGGGRYVNSAERDRVRALQLFARALEFAGADRLGGGQIPRLPQKDARRSSAPERAALRLQAAAVLTRDRSGGRGWRLQEPTDLATLPDYAEGYSTPGDERGSPVDADGAPVYHLVPERWADAKSDGERWRWLLHAAAGDDPGRADEVLMQRADFARSQFGEQTLADYAALLRGDAGGAERTGAWALHTLGENEAIARLATGVRRLALPEEYRFIALFRAVADGTSGYAAGALERLAETFENRRQFEQAARIWERRIREHGESATARRHLDQIRLPWGEFDALAAQPAGRGATVDFRFRNGRKARFEAREIDVRRLLADVKDYLRDDPRQIDWPRVDLEQIGWRLVTQKQTRYLGRVAASWELALEPRPDHFDRRITVATPLQRAGAYLVEAQLEGGNTTRIILWVNDAVIVQKPLDGRSWYYTADAATGAPLPGATLEFFGYRQEPTDWQKIVGRRYHVLTKAYTAVTDADGQVVPPPEALDGAYTWIVTATAGGRLAWRGWASVWRNRIYDAEYNETKVYTITDRPVYRPDQSVKYKLWARNARYDEEGPSAHAGRTLTLVLANPRGETVLEKQVLADEYGGVAGEYALPRDAALGIWHFTLSGWGGGTFRVEEYKKPEFEVTVEAPEAPAALGEKIVATVRARYYFGAPVADAKVVFKVRRTPHAARWYPPGLWDWCFGPGYWWFAPDYTWYPGWSRWGVMRPLPFWWPQPSAPPELVAEQEGRIGEDGTVRVEIDTALALALHGDKDHRYEIVAEVTDRSRRTIVGTGEVIVARRPFAVWAWVDRGHYRAGETVQADFLAQTVDRKPVAGDATAALHRVRYVKGEAVETAVQHWKLRTDAEGRAHLQVKAAEAGQYRIACTVRDARGRSAEGGYLFTVAGPGFDGGDFRFSAVELIPDRREYAPGDTVKLRVNADRAGAAVLLFARPVNGVYLPPKLLRLQGKSVEEAIAVVKRDMPNFFVEALTVSGGRVHTELREIVVPPEKKVLNVAVLPSAERYLPGAKARVRVKVTDLAGRPFAGTAVLAVYDQAVEYVSGGSNVPEIREFFWKWRRHHAPATFSSADRWSGPLHPSGEQPMGDVGLFGRSAADDESAAGKDDARGGDRQGLLRAKSHMAMAPQPASAPLGAVAEGAASFAKKESASMADQVVGGEYRADKPQERGAAVVEPTVRSSFADTAFWSPAVEIGRDGIGVAEFAMPENLTGWKMRAWALGDGTAVGEGSAKVVTAKNVLVRLQAPRFFVERDEVVLSANVHNYLKNAKSVRAVLELDGGCLEAIDGAPRTLEIAAGGEARADWRVRAVHEGEAIVRVKALTDEESDAMEQRFPVRVHGMVKTVSWSGAVRRPGASANFSFTLPAERRVDQTRLEVRFSPTLAGALVDALPYLVDYPYGCTEQTLNRFLPAAIVQKTLRDLGVPLDEVRKKRTNLNAQELGDPAARARQWRRLNREPVFDESEVRSMVRAGLQRLAAMQVSDGGWGWFSGYGEHSWPHTTVVVVHGLQAAAATGERLPDGMLERGLSWLEGWQEGEVAKLRNARFKIGDWKERADELDALAFATLADAGREQGALLEYLLRDRAKLAPAGLAHLGLGLQKLGKREDLAATLRNLEQYLVEDAENQTVWLRLPGDSWWYWWGSETETLAAYLKLLARTDPKGARAAGLAKYLLNNRKHGTYWNSTRDTALAIEALAEFLQASGEDRPDMTVEILLDGAVKKTVRITGDDLFTFDNTLVVEGAALGAGKHALEIRRRGAGPLYANAAVSYFSLEEFITKAGLEVKVERSVYKLVRADRDLTVSGSRGQAVRQRAERHQRIALRDGATLASGDLVEIELKIDSKNDYEYLIVEDFKAAGLEPVDVRSGYTGDGVGAYLELRDERAAFFLRALPRGATSVSYRLRAEIPGRFSALPTTIAAMYAPELKGNADEIRLRVADEEEKRR
jgi:uncharacterized protein YfaS (alpha-2-macroglobulin family)